MRGATRGLVTVGLALALLGLGAGSASAQIVVLPDQVDPGARDVTLTFRLTDTDPATRTVRLQVFLPTGRPLVGVSAPAPSGWTSRLSVEQLPTPAPSVDGPVGETVTRIEWSTTGSAAGTGPVDLPVLVRLMPDGAGPVRFRALRTDAAGRSEEWSNTWAEGAAPPAHDALLVRLGDAPPPPVFTGTHGDHHGAEAAAAGAAATAAPASSGEVAATIAGLGLLAAVLAAVSATLGRRQRRRFENVRADSPEPHRTGPRA
jgi:hypothetical protein